MRALLARYAAALGLPSSTRCRSAQPTPKADDAGSAFADPCIVVDPGFLASHPGDSVGVDDGIGNEPLISPVPEPETWAPMLAGITVMASIVRRHGSASRWDTAFDFAPTAAGP